LVSGDNVLRTFPNIAPIRGTKMRSPEEWIASLNKLLALQADCLLPGHTRPIIGADNVRSVITAYRDAVKSILDQTMAGITRGKRPDELVQQVKLPPELAANPYVQEFYGTVEWMVRGLYADRLGWFDGNATNVFPMTGTERAEKLLPLLGGPERVLSGARDALSAQQYKWAAELADFVIAVDGSNNDAKRIKAEALTQLGEGQGNAIARNYYLSVAQQLKQSVTSP
jgi:alkyl sulfatase BDS1-like metallo-beta-lactamase superfamily hydrolase